MCEKLHGMQDYVFTKILGTFCLCLFPYVVRMALNIPNWSSMADDAITQGGISQGSSFYICDIDSKPMLGI